MAYIIDANGNFVPTATVSGADGREIELRATTDYLQWRYIDLEWQNLIAILDLKGSNGDKGDDGITPSLRVVDNTLQWRSGDLDTWKDLYVLPLVSLHASQHATGGTDVITPASIGAAASNHSHGNITNDGEIGTTANLPVFTGVNGVLNTINAATALTNLGAAAALSQLTTLPTSGTALANNAEYRVSAAVGTYAFAWPTSPFEVWLKFSTAAAVAITFPAGTSYIGGAPTFKASSAYEMSVKDGVVIVQEVKAS